MGSFINLREEWLLGIDTLDDQHREISEGLNRISEVSDEYSRLDNEEKEKQGELLSELIDALYGKTREHFKFEENMMKDEGYPGYAEHAREHAMLLAELKTTIAARLESGRVSVDPDIFKALKSWFIVHLTQSDRNFAHYITLKKSVEADD